MEEPVQTPDQYLCPISTQLMKDPVIAGDGITYQRQSILKWMEKSNDSPFTGKILPHKTIITNYALKNVIQRYSKNLSTIKKQKQVRINLEHALKMRQQQIKNYLEKVETTYSKSQKEDQNNLIKIKQLQKDLMIQRRLRIQTQKQLQQYKDKCMAFEFQLKECKCFKDVENQKKNGLLDMILKPFAKNNPQQKMKEVVKFPQVSKILKNAKKIHITPNIKGYDFKSNLKVDQNNKNICISKGILGGGYIFSNQQLPIKKNQNFYFSIQALQILEGNNIGIGISYPKFYEEIQCDPKVIGYHLATHTIYKFKESFKQQYPYNSFIISKYPSQIICFVNLKDNHILIIYNNQVQMKIPLEKQMILQSKQCRAFVILGNNSKIKLL